MQSVEMAGDVVVASDRTSMIFGHSLTPKCGDDTHIEIILRNRAAGENTNETIELYLQIL